MDRTQFEMIKEIIEEIESFDIYQVNITREFYIFKQKDFRDRILILENELKTIVKDSPEYNKLQNSIFHINDIINMMGERIIEGGV